MSPTKPAAPTATVRYAGPANGRELIGVPELSKDYVFSPANNLTEPLAEADREWFVTYPGQEFVIEEPSPS